MSDLNEQAKAALEAMLEQTNMVLPYTAQSIARLMWLEGFKAGSDATLAVAREVIEAQA